MKKLTILRDKKIFYFVVIAMFYEPITMYFMFRFSYFKDVRNMDFKVFWCMFILGIFLFFIILIKQVCLKIKINGNKASAGLTSMQTFYLNTITGIHFADKIVLSFKNVRRKFSIKVIDIINNEDKYRKLIEHLKKNSNIIINTEKAIETLKQNRQNKYKMEEGKSLPFRGFLILLLIHLIIVLIGYVLGVLANLYLNVALSTPIEFPNFIMFIVMLPYGLYVLYNVLKKRKKTLNILKTYIWIEAISLIIPNILTTIFIKESVTYLNYIQILIGIPSIILRAMIILRYLAISQRVKNTFINE